MNNLKTQLEKIDKNFSSNEERYLYKIKESKKQ